MAESTPPQTPISKLLASLAHIISSVPAGPKANLKVLRFAVLVVIFSTLMIVPLRMTPNTAKLVSLTFLFLIFVVATSLLTILRFLLTRAVVAGKNRLGLSTVHSRIAVPLLAKQVSILQGVGRLVYKAGIALPGLVFVGFWALVYLLIWSFEPQACHVDQIASCQGAFRGISSYPSFSDFLYLSANLAFGHYTPDIIAQSQVAKTAATVEVISDVGLVTLYAATFLGIKRGASKTQAEEETPPAKQ